MEIVSKFFRGDFQHERFVSVKRNIALPTGSVFVARRGGLVPSVSPRVARKRDE